MVTLSLSSGKRGCVLAGLRLSFEVRHKCGPSCLFLPLFLVAIRGFPRVPRMYTNVDAPMLDESIHLLEMMVSPPRLWNRIG
jgi:hypothetical protein